MKSHAGLMLLIEYRVIRQTQVLPALTYGRQVVKFVPPRHSLIEFTKLNIYCAQKKKFTFE